MKKIKLISLLSLLSFIVMIIFSSCVNNETPEEMNNVQTLKKDKIITLVSSDKSFRIANDITSLIEDITTTTDNEVIEIISTDFFKDRDGNDMAYVFYSTPSNKKANILFVSRKAKLILPSEVIFQQSAKGEYINSKVAPPIKITCGGCSPCRVYYNPSSGDVHCESECCTMTVS